MKTTWKIVFALFLLLPLAGCEEEERKPDCEEEEATPTTPPADFYPDPPIYSFDFEFVDERTQERVPADIWGSREITASCSGFSGPITYDYFKTLTERDGMKPCDFVNINSGNNPTFGWITEWLHFETYSIRVEISDGKTYDILLEQEFTNRGDCDEERKVHIYLDGEYVHEADIERVNTTGELAIIERVGGYPYFKVAREDDNVSLPINLSDF